MPGGCAAEASILARAPPAATAAAADIPPVRQSAYQAPGRQASPVCRGHGQSAEKRLRNGGSMAKGPGGTAKRIPRGDWAFHSRMRMSLLSGVGACFFVGLGSARSGEPRRSRASTRMAAMRFTSLTAGYSGKY